MRICIDARFSGYAGIGRFVRGLWSGLLEAEADVIGLYPRRPSGYLGPQQFKPAGPYVAVGAVPFRPAEQALLPYILWREHADLYHSPHLTLPYVARLPLVLTVHDLNPWLHPEAARSISAGKYYRFFFPRAVRRADAVVTVSDSVAADIEQHLHRPRQALAVIEHGVDADWRPRPEAEIREVLDRLSVTQPYVLYVGTAKRWKNLATVFAALEPGSPMLVLAGPTQSELAALPRPGGAVRAVGRLREELPALYSGALALVMPSLTESVGFPVLEAMATGTPVITSDAPGLLNTAGDAALVVPALEVSAWRAAINRVAADAGLRSDLAAKGFRRVKNRTWRRAAEQYLNVYETVLLRDRSHP